MTPLSLHVLGVGFWAPGLNNWAAAQPALRGEGMPVPTGVDTGATAARRPAPALLPPAERRRAPDSVALALEVATQATAQAAAAGIGAAALPAVFACTHGDLAITDEVCRTLAQEPLLLSPTKFHNSVHNAAAGYWTIGCGAMAASSALTAHEQTFAAGFVEAAALAAADDTAVLLVAYDVAATGALASLVPSRGLLAYALVLAPLAVGRVAPAITWQVAVPAVGVSTQAVSALPALQHNAAAGGLPLLAALARAVTAPAAPQQIHLPLTASGSQVLSLTVSPAERD